MPMASYVMLQGRLAPLSGRMGLPRQTSPLAFARGRFLSPVPLSGNKEISRFGAPLRLPVDCRVGLSVPMTSAAAEEKEEEHERRGRSQEGDATEGDFDPGAPPPFGLAEIREAIPKHLWVKNPWRSVSYVVRDVAIVLGLAAAAAHLNNWMVWPLYWLAQGTMFWALFVLGHDCGHGSFSNNAKLNSVFGHFLHSSILVPYHGWRISHRTHHQNHGHVDKDESWHPLSEELYTSLDSPARFLRFTLPFPLLAFPLYLVTNKPAHRSYFVESFALPPCSSDSYAPILSLLFLIGSLGTQFLRTPGRKGSHFHPDSDLFLPKEKKDVLTSTACWTAMAGLLAGLTWLLGPLQMLKLYFAPYVIFVIWLDLVTYLHHHGHEEKLPWYRGKEWSYLRGGLTTLDRDYGWINGIHHDIGTHVIHHLFPQIPHYNLVEATEAARPVLGKYYREPRKSGPLPFHLLGDLVRSLKQDHFVSDAGDVVYYRRKDSASAGDGAEERH